MLLLTKAGEVLNTRNLGVLLTYVINVSLALPSILSVLRSSRKKGLLSTDVTASWNRILAKIIGSLSEIL